MVSIKKRKKHMKMTWASPPSQVGWYFQEHIPPHIHLLPGIIHDREPLHPVVAPLQPSLPPALQGGVKISSPEARWCRARPLRLGVNTENTDDDHDDDEDMHDDDNTGACVTQAEDEHWLDE